MANKTGNTYTSGTMADRMTVLTANYGFSTTPSSQKHWAIATTTDNRKLQYGRFARQSCNFWQSVVVAIVWLTFCRTRHYRRSRIWRGNLDAICQRSRYVIISGLAAISIFSVVGRCCTYLPTLFSAAISDYRSLLHFLRVCHGRML